jgi:hypothetical protein
MLDITNDCSKTRPAAPSMRDSPFDTLYIYRCRPAIYPDTRQLLTNKQRLCFLHFLVPNMFTPIALLRQQTFTFDEMTFPFFYRWKLSEGGKEKGQLDFRRFDEVPKQTGNDMTAGDLFDNGYISVSGRALLLPSSSVLLNPA